MPYKKIPKQFTIEMVHRVIILINSIPRQGGIYQILSPKEIVTGKKFPNPHLHWSIRAGLASSSNDIEKEWSIDSFYLGRKNNGSGHLLSRLDTRSVVLVNQVKQISILSLGIDRINAIEEAKINPNGIKPNTMEGRVTLQDLELNQNDDDDDDDDDDDTVASDDSFVQDKEYEKNFKNELKLNRGPTNEN